jgi:MATE family multidrug resistance protein
MRLPGQPELVATARLALPIVLAQIGLTAMGVVDTLMVGRVSAQAIAAVALGHLYFMTLVMLAAGTLMVLDPIIAQAVGARDELRVALGLQRGLLLSLLLALVASAALWPVPSVLALLRQPAELVGLSSDYVRISILGVLPYLVFVVLRQSLQAQHRVRVVVLAVVAANLLNAALNWVLVYGKLGAPPMGVSGSAWATVASRWLMALALLAGGWGALRSSMVPWRPRSHDASALARMFRLGAPIGLQHALEWGAFSTIGLLMGVLGTHEMAAHQIAISLASLTFMVPLGVGAAAAVRVGHAVGSADLSAARERASAALVCGVGFMLVMGVVLVAAPRAIAALYTRDVAVVGLAALLIPIAGVFQVFDGIQAVCAGVLRGLGDTRAPFLINLAGFWLAGLPVSVALGFYSPLGAAGLWWGFVAGLGVVAILLLLRVRNRLRRPLTATTVDGAASALAPER